MKKSNLRKLDKFVDKVLKCRVPKRGFLSKREEKEWDMDNKKNPKAFAINAEEFMRDFEKLKDGESMSISLKKKKQN